MARRSFRFGLQLAQPFPGMDWIATARRVEDMGFSTLLMPDHFEDQLAPVPALAAAAAATTTLRVGALVFGNDYRHPVVLAKEMATLDVVSGGRMEFGIGAGWMRTDYDGAGMIYDRPGIRIDRMTESLEIVRGLWAEGPLTFEGRHYRIDGLDGLPKPVQGRPKILIGGGGKRMLTLAALHADIVGVTANLAGGAVDEDAIADSAPERYDQKIEWIREAAGDRFDELELSSLSLSLSITDDRATMLAGVAEMFGMPVDDVAQTPAILVGSVEEICETLEARRERWGFSYPVFHPDQDLDATGAIVARLAGT